MYCNLVTLSADIIKCVPLLSNIPSMHFCTIILDTVLPKAVIYTHSVLKTNILSLLHTLPHINHERFTLDLPFLWVYRHPLSYKQLVDDFIVARGIETFMTIILTIESFHSIMDF